MSSQLKTSRLAPGICSDCRQYSERLFDGSCGVCLQPIKQPVVVPEHSHWMETIHGTPMDYLNPQESSIDIREISWALAGTPRFCAHTATDLPYCVADHSCWVATYLFQKTKSPWIALHGLMHDAHEAYTGDIPKPLKSIPEVHAALKPIEDRLQSCILRALKIPEMVPEIAELVKEADAQALAVEVTTVKGSTGKNWRKHLPPVNSLAARLMPPVAKDRPTHHTKFMAAYKTLYGKGFTVQ